MTKNTKFIALGSLALVALALSACGIAQPRANGQTAAAPGYVNGPGGMMNGGMTHAPARSAGVGGGHMGTSMMGGYGYDQSAPTVEPTPLGALPMAVDEEIQITASNLRFSPAQVTVTPGETVRFVVTNNDSYLHNFVSQDAGIPFLTLPGNTTGTVTWTAPNRPGTYDVWCDSCCGGKDSPTMHGKIVILPAEQA